jgi:hypothetical protein
MGKLSGTVLILAGVSLAAYTLSSQYEGAATFTATPGTVSTKVHGPAVHGSSVQGPAPDARGAGARVAGPRASEVTAAVATAVQPPLAAKPAPDATAAVPPPSGEAAAPASGVPSADAPAVPVPGARRMRSASVVQIGEAPPRMPVGEPEAVARPPLDRPALARQIQRQLKRIGCYSGQVTGAWTPSVQQAMTTLMGRANASLPIDEPDPVLLAMVESQSVGACSKTCPAGQGRAADGRCQPEAAVAGNDAANAKRRPVAGTGRASRKSQMAGTVQPATPAEVSAAPSTEGRMSLAGPTAAPQAARPARRGRATTYRARPPSYRSAGIPPRERYRAAQRPYYGFSAWPLPFPLP